MSSLAHYGMEYVQPEIPLKHARFDVRKFGIKGMAEADKEGATVAMLMQLGAKVS